MELLDSAVDISDEFFGAGDEGFFPVYRLCDLRVEFRDIYL